MKYCWFLLPLSFFICYNFIEMNIQAISNAIVKRRKMLSVSQKELADLAGVSLHSIINLESGRGNPTLQLLLTVVEVLGMKMQLEVKDVLRQMGDSDD